MGQTDHWVEMYQRVVLLSLPQAQSIDIEFSDITYEARDGLYGPTKSILKGVSGNFQSGQLTVIMGPSGAGKSTLLNILTGFENKGWKGNIEYIGKEGKHTWKEYRKQSCYIQQDDSLNPLFTVWEAMSIAANLKIGSSLSQKARGMLIDDVLENLDLSRSKQTRCGRLSGGQKKRLSIALELLDNPPVMFLDEPTTGLDSLSSHQCIRLLHSLAAAGRTIICTIHQPSAAIYELCDEVYLLSEGRCMYQGATKNTVTYFGSVGLQCPKYHNPADYMIEVVNMEYGNFNDQLIQLASSKDKCWRLDSAEILKGKAENYMGEIKTRVLIEAPSEVERFFVLLRRCMIQLFRDWTTTHVKVILHLLMGTLMGLLFAGSSQDASKTISNAGFLFVSCAYLTYTSMMPAVFKFPSEFPILKRERFNNWYQLRTYYVASLISSIPVQTLFAVIYSSAAYYISHQPMEMNRFLMFLAIAILTTIIAESVGLLIGSLVNPINGTFLGAIIICALLSVTGFLALYNSMPKFLYYCSYLSYLKFAIHGFMHAIYGFDREKIFCPKTYCHYRAPDSFMTDFSMGDGRFWIDVAILCFNCVLFRFVTYCTLKRKLTTA